MVISNIGTIVLSLPPSSSPSGVTVVGIPSTDSATSTQVRILSLSNTISRLLVGPVADFVSPVVSYLPNGDRSYPRKHRVSRIAFLVGSTILLACTYFWTEVGIRSQAAVWALRYVYLSIEYEHAASSAWQCWCRDKLWRHFYSLVRVQLGSLRFPKLHLFLNTCRPSLISSIWGLSNLGRNFGIITYAPFVGTPIFSYLYAFVSAGHTNTGQGSVCKGVECWQPTFWIGFAGALVALCGSGVLWRQWKGKVWICCICVVL